MNPARGTFGSTRPPSACIAIKGEDRAESARERMCMNRGGHTYGNGFAYLSLNLFRNILLDKELGWESVRILEYRLGRLHTSGHFAVPEKQRDIGTMFASLQVDSMGAAGGNLVQGLELGLCNVGVRVFKPQRRPCRSEHRPTELVLDAAAADSSRSQQKCIRVEGKVVR